MVPVTRGVVPAFSRTSRTDLVELPVYAPRLQVPPFLIHAQVGEQWGTKYAAIVRL
jgi:hypothetical protein